MSYENQPHWVLGPKIRVTVSQFKNQKFVNIRETFEKDGVVLPGKKGIVLKPKEFEELCTRIDEIRKEIESKPESGESKIKAHRTSQPKSDEFVRDE